MLTLGVPTLRCYDLLERLIVSAEAGERVPDRYLIIDNGNKLGTPAWLPVGKTEVIVPNGNIGVAASWNIIVNSSDDPAIISGDDVVLEHNTISEMMRVSAESDADFVYPNPNFQHASMFVCFLVRKRLFDTVGSFDEGFYPAYFEDNDYHTRMKLVGATEATAPCRYEHVLSATLKRANHAETNHHKATFNANHQRYREKWGGSPGNETYRTPWNK